jgi:CRP/FNR family transcriptional regulator
MTEAQTFLATVPLFASLTTDELALVGELATAVEWDGGEIVYSIADAGDAAFVVREGVVELFSIVGGIERLFMTARPGGVFGLLSLIDDGERPGSARAAEKTRALMIRRDSFSKLLAAHPETGIKLLENLGLTLGRQVRTLIEQYRATVAWNLEITGLTSLNLERLMTERVEVTVETVRG